MRALVVALVVGAAAGTATAVAIAAGGAVIDRITEIDRRDPP